MGFILDTDALSTFRRAKPHLMVAGWVGRTGWRLIATSVVSITEIQRGVERARVQHPDVAGQVEAWLEGLLDGGLMEVLPLGIDAARVLGRMYERKSLRNFKSPILCQRGPRRALTLPLQRSRLRADGLWPAGTSPILTRSIQSFGCPAFSIRSH